MYELSGSRCAPSGVGTQMKMASHSLSRSKSVVAAYLLPATAAAIRASLEADASEGERVVGLASVAKEKPRRLARHVQAAVAGVDARAVLEQVGGGLLGNVLRLTERDGEVVARSARQLADLLDSIRDFVPDRCLVAQQAEIAVSEVVGRDAVAHRDHLADLAGGEPPRASALGGDVRLHPELLMEAQVLLVGPVDQRGNDEEDGRDPDAGEPSGRLE